MTNTFIKNFKKFEKKIVYTVADYDLNENILNHKGGESKIEIHQRNNLANGLDKASGIWRLALRDELLFAWRDLELLWISSIIVFQELQESQRPLQRGCCAPHS